MLLGAEVCDNQVFGDERSWADQIIKHFINQGEQWPERGSSQLSVSVRLIHILTSVSVGANQACKPVTANLTTIVINKIAHKCQWEMITMGQITPTTSTWITHLHQHFKLFTRWKRLCVPVDALYEDAAYIRHALMSFFPYTTSITTTRYGSYKWKVLLYNWEEDSFFFFN